LLGTGLPWELTLLQLHREDQRKDGRPRLWGQMGSHGPPQSCAGGNSKERGAEQQELLQTLRPNWGNFFLQGHGREHRARRGRVDFPIRARNRKAVPAADGAPAANRGHARLGEEGNQHGAGPRARHVLSAGLGALQEPAQTSGTSKQRPRVSVMGFRCTLQRGETWTGRETHG